MSDARKDKRTLLSLKIRYKSATLEDFIERYSGDISSGGVFIKAKKPLAVGTLLKFEFMLQDQSSLIHGVGRVVWRRDESESDAHNQAGMGIKFIKMDPASRGVVQRIADDRNQPGVFDHGKAGIQPSSLVPSDPDQLGEADQTKVRHVSEFLATALEEGGAGEAATTEARAGVERAQRASGHAAQLHGGPARGAFSAPQEVPTQKRHSVSDAPARGAMSAFGGSGMGAGARMSSAAPAMDELDLDDDFLDDETTKVHELGASDYPDADATVIAKEASPFARERRETPLVPASTTPPAASPLESAVPDLFGPDSFGPAPGSQIDASLLDPAVPTVPPPSAASGIPSEAFRVPQAPAAVSPGPSFVTAKPEKSSRGWLLAFLFAVLLGAGGVAAWQLGLLDDLIDMAAPYLGLSEDTASAPVAATPRPTPVAQPEKPAPVTQDAAAANQAELAEATEEVAVEEAAAAAPAELAEAALVKLQITSVPNGAFVSINGKGAGRTPLSLEYEVGTKLSIFSKARGYLARRKTVTVQAEPSPVKLVLGPLPYVVELVTEPAGAQASAVGGGEVTTPGTLTFRSMTGSRKIIVSKDGYKTASKSVTRTNFVEEPRRMAALIKVTLVKDGASAPLVDAPAAEVPAAAPAAAPAAPAEPATSPAAAEAATPAAPEPKAVELAPTPSETPAADAP